MRQPILRLAARLLSVLCYLVLVLWLLNFNIRLLIDIKSLSLVVFGTLLLTAGCYKRGMTLDELRGYVLWNSMLAGFFTTFMLLFSILYQNTPPANLLPGIALCMRPLFYTLLIQAVCKPVSSENHENKETPETTIPAHAAPTMEEIKYLLREQELTERELEIALAIWKNMPNKEIAEKLFIAESTVKKHTTSLYKKLSVANREQLKQYLDNLQKQEKS